MKSGPIECRNKKRMSLAYALCRHAVMEDRRWFAITGRAINPRSSRWSLGCNWAGRLAHQYDRHQRGNRRSTR